MDSSWMDEQGQEFGMWPPGAPEGGVGKGALGFTGGFLAFLVGSGLGKGAWNLTPFTSLCYGKTG